MTDRPIIFSAPMVRALLEGRKTQTRRLLKPQPTLTDEDRVRCVKWRGAIYSGNLRIPYASGDRLYVREACRAEELSRPPSTRPATKTEREKLGRTTVPVLDELDGCDGVRFLADDAWIKIENSMDASDRWGAMFHYRGRGKDGIGNNVPPIHMPRWASRLTLTVTEVRVQRLQDISASDAIEEGINPCLEGHNCPEGAGGACCGQYCPQDNFHDLWESLHGPDAWDANLWVVALTFTVQRGNIDGGAA